MFKLSPSTCNKFLRRMKKEIQFYSINYIGKCYAACEIYLLRWIEIKHIHSLLLHLLTKMFKEKIKYIFLVKEMIWTFFFFFSNDEIWNTFEKFSGAACPKFLRNIKANRLNIFPWDADWLNNVQPLKTWIYSNLVLGEKSLNESLVSASIVQHNILSWVKDGCNL